MAMLQSSLPSEPLSVGSCGGLCGVAAEAQWASPASCRPLVLTHRGNNPPLAATRWAHFPRWASNTNTLVLTNPPLSLENLNLEESAGWLVGWMVPLAVHKKKHHPAKRHKHVSLSFPEIK